MTTAKDWAIKGTFYECCRGAEVLNNFKFRVFVGS